jgi:hypothetical protein
VDLPSQRSRAPSTGYVPVEQRWLGLDRRTIPLAAVVLGLMLLFMAVIPAINDAIGWDDETEAGDVLDLGAGVTFVPPAGWELTKGIRVDDEPSTGVSGDGAASISDGGVAVTVERSGFDGTPAELLDQVNLLRTASDADPNRSFKLTGPRKTFTTASGITGVSEAYTSANGEGRIIALTLDAGADGGTPTGIAVTIDADDQAYATRSDEIDALIDSLTFEEPSP